MRSRKIYLSNVVMRKCFAESWSGYGSQHGSSRLGRSRNVLIEKIYRLYFIFGLFGFDPFVDIVTKKIPDQKCLAVLHSWNKKFYSHFNTVGKNYEAAVRGIIYRYPNEKKKLFLKNMKLEQESLKNQNYHMFERTFSSWVNWFYHFHEIFKFFMSIYRKNVINAGQKSRLLGIHDEPTYKEKYFSSAVTKKIGYKTSFRKII